MLVSQFSIIRLFQSMLVSQFSNNKVISIHVGEPPFVIIRLFQSMLVSHQFSNNKVISIHVGESV